MRSAEIHRATGETDVSVRLDLDGGPVRVDTGVGFLDHMMTLFAAHGRFGLSVTCRGDTCVDDHHSVEDIAIALGQAVKAALGDRRGIRRYGHILLPMDEALALAAVDLSGRGLLCAELAFPSEKIGTFDTELVAEFLQALAREGAMTLHVRLLAGANSHHMAEAVFKGVARCLRQAVAIDPEAAGEIPSTKGVL